MQLHASPLLSVVDESNAHENTVNFAHNCANGYLTKLSVTADILLIWF